MNVLLDTHAFLWRVTNNPQISEKARHIIEDKGNRIYFSAASAWEITIKAGTGKLSLPEPPGKYIPGRLTRNYFEALPILLSHTLQIGSLPPHHRDPFDRILIAQSQIEALPILTVDEQITRYEVMTLW